MTAELLAKYENLKNYISGLKRVVVAYSSGVDSTFLMYAAHNALGCNAIAVTASSCLFPKRELDEAVKYCNTLGINHIILHPDELSIDGFASNPPDRCYICKYDLFTQILNIAHENGTDFVLEGSNLDDEGDYRPGLKAITELGIISPLRIIGFTKQEIRDLSSYFGIHTWDKPSFACLASRFPYGEAITAEKLSMVEQAEQYLLGLGFKQFRVRIHNNLARIELYPEEFPRLLADSTRNDVYSTFKHIGFTYVSLDLIGYRTGSMNETLAQC